ncbi:MAG: phosphate acyltransferase PlsX [Eggerthellaceae bacterium]|jgi:glycerol-3-phosphate acyltransferase PlsX
MTEMITVAVDAMGGDHAPDVVLDGAEQALRASERLKVLLCGPAEVVEPFAASHERCEAVPCTEVIAMDEHPAQAVRNKKDSSIVVGCRMVKDGRAAGFFTAGSTGAGLAAGTLVIGRIKGVQRPAIATVVPKPGRPLILCDVGANADCKVSYLVQFAQMASVYARLTMGVRNPEVGLLNIGSEDTKGSQFAQECFTLLKEQLSNFKGNAEGTSLFTDDFDVIVTDGFTGNVTLKTFEGTARFLFGLLRDAATKAMAEGGSSGQQPAGLMRIAGQLKQTVNPDTYGGAPILGLRGTVLIGHGASNATAIMNGILATARCIEMGVTEATEEAIAQIREETHG